MSSLEDLAFDAEHAIDRTRAFFPILAHLGNEWARQRPFDGQCVGCNLHLTTLTAAFLRELALGGATVVVSAANPGTTDPGTVQLLRNAGIEVYTGGDLRDRHRQVLANHPAWLLDTSFDLIAAALDQPDRDHTLCGGIVLSRTAVHRMRSHPTRLSFPVVNLHNGRLQDTIQHHYGVGSAVWTAVTTLTGMNLAGRRTVVVGYGPIGRGIAEAARSAGMAVEVVERDAVRRLFAHYDGFPTPDLPTALAQAHVAVTATGQGCAIRTDDLLRARNGVTLLNAGTGGDEIDVRGIEQACETVDHITDGVIRYQMESGRQITVLGQGHPLNIVLNSGSPEPVLLQFTLLGAALQWLVSAKASPGECVLPDHVEQRTAELALRALESAGTSP